MSAIEVYKPGGAYRWALAIVGAGHYHGVEMYTKAVVELLAAREALLGVPVFGAGDERDLAGVEAAIKGPQPIGRGALIGDKHRLEAKRARYMMAVSRLRSAEWGVRYARAYLMGRGEKIALEIVERWMGLVEDKREAA